MTPPRDPVAAVTHQDPYPYYAELVACRPLYRDDALGLWVASSAAAVRAVLSHPAGRVRPPAEPVPAAIVGSPAGDIFRRLIRMNDGVAHDCMKRAVSATLDAVDPARIDVISRERAHALVAALAPQHDVRQLTDFAFQLTAEVVASLLGAERDSIAAVAGWTKNFVGGIAPGAPRDVVQRGRAAAAHLLDIGAELQAGGGLVTALSRRAPDDPAAAVANALGLLSQAYEATTGLIGNTLLALARHAPRNASMPALVREVARHDSPVQNTRRFLAEDAAVMGARMEAGDGVLVVLAAANRDPAVNPDAAAFDPGRVSPVVFTFGTETHACPGSAIATAIAGAAVETLLDAGLQLERLTAGVSYRPSGNVRVPVFG